ncbi:hypothetical protein CORC01_02429 [Colletotrichum orchidophilum]|uniref:Uncharacterized protein n=1 Tax=Colletotrichum orchidophilum TaxID=1209926 RepID=A0A1G4BL12_9PEZI|nr:uncharacterized protein CORC01_02429 [Colletotrichum orchidophilum]OHF02149.1 hypothetical protein CORC01_02429 [Colletotrichum orchidophilum]
MQNPPRRQHASILHPLMVSTTFPQSVSSAVLSSGADKRGDRRASSGVLGAGPAGVKLAIPALENAPVGSRMAKVAGPLDQSAVRLDHLERVGAGTRDGHLEARAGGSLGSLRTGRSVWNDLEVLEALCVLSVMARSNAVLVSVLGLE